MTIFRWFDDVATVRNVQSIFCHLMATEMIRDRMLTGDAIYEMLTCRIDVDTLPSLHCQKGNPRSVSFGNGNKTFSCWR